MMRNYEVTVTELLVKTLSISAETEEQAIEEVENMLRREELVLTADDYSGREIAVTFDSEVAEPRTSLYVACCGEFHGMAPMYDGILDAKEALRKYEEAMKNYGSFVPEIGIKLSYDEDLEQGSELGLLQGRVLDLSLIDYIEEIVNDDRALRLIGDLVSVVKEEMDVPFPCYRIDGESLVLNKTLAL